jgi:nitrite reductase/ring-hydroxylating ferredoxin subunit
MYHSCLYNPNAVTDSLIVLDTTGSDTDTAKDETILTLSVSDPLYSTLSVVGGTMKLNNGYGAILIVTRLSISSVTAYNANCTYDTVVCALPNAGGYITCPACSSQYDVDDGSVVEGPATIPLTGYTATVSGDTIRIKQE